MSAGNAGPGQSTITTPADDPFVITVGAADDNGTATLGDDRVASWSSQGPTAFDGIAKPDVVAPGRKMIGLRAAGSAIDTAYPERRVTAPGSTTARYFTMSGTSMAAPVVAGAAALFLERSPRSSPRVVKRQLTGTAHPLAGVEGSSNAVVLQGFRIPALSTRRTETELELRGCVGRSMTLTTQDPELGTVLAGKSGKARAGCRDHGLVWR